MIRPTPFGTLVDPPVVLLVAAALVTRLADAAVLLVGVALLYWLAPPVAANPRSVGATMVGVAIGALAVTLGSKAIFAAPRPPGAGTVAFDGPLAWLVRGAANADGFAFPSGHATAATVVYGGLAAFLDVWRRRTRIAVAAVVILAVAATRVVLGVHYVSDVLAGMVVGLATLAAFLRVARRGFRPRPDRALFLAGSLGVLAAIAAAVGGHGDSVVGAAVAAGGGFGGYLVWRLRGPDDTPLGPAWTLVGLGVVGSAFAYATHVAEEGLPVVIGVFPDTVGLRTVVACTVAAIGVATLIAWPTVRRLARARIGRAPRGNADQ